MKTKSGLGTKLNGTKKIDSSHARRRKAVDFVMFTSDIRAITRTTKGNVQQNKRHTAQITAMKTSQKAIVPKTDRAWSVFGDSARPENECTYTHVSLFSGCGGIDLGFRQAGFKTLLANDIDPGACQTYRANLGEIIEGDVLNLSLPKLERRLDVLTAGFPCQPFSNAGSRKGVADYRGTLYQTAIDIVRKLEPRSIVFENVRGLLSFKSGNKLLIEEICEQLDTIGYDVVFSLVDSSRHHVPQRRLRLVIVGVERSANNGRFSFPEPVDRTDLSLEHTILDLQSGDLNQNELMQLNPQALRLGEMVPEGGSWKNIAYDKLPDRLKHIADNMERYRWPNFYRRFHRTEVAGTITASFKPENAGVWHPIEKRILSVREIARIQSFPDWFDFTGRTVKSKYEQIGNAVPPRLAYEIAMQLVKSLNKQDLRCGRDFLTFPQFVNSGKPLRACDRDVVFSSQIELPFEQEVTPKKGGRLPIMGEMIAPAHKKVRVRNVSQ